MELPSPLRRCVRLGIPLATRKKPDSIGHSRHPPGARPECCLGEPGSPEVLSSLRLVPLASETFSPFPKGSRRNWEKLCPSFCSRAASAKVPDCSPVAEVSTAVLDSTRLAPDARQMKLWEFATIQILIADVSGIDRTSWNFKRRRDFVADAFQVRNTIVEPQSVEASNVLTKHPTGLCRSDITRNTSGQIARSSSAPLRFPA
jgi:hypothetical protein